MDAFFNFMQTPLFLSPNGAFTVATAICSIFGAFAFTFVAAICWGKLVEHFGPAGGFMAGFLIVGTLWLLNHKLPGFLPGMGLDPNVVAKDLKLGMGGDQYGLIFQAGGPWIDMGCAVGFGLWVCSLFSGAKVGSSCKRILIVVLGGLFGGAMVGLTTFTGNGVGFGGDPGMKEAQISKKVIIQGVAVEKAPTNADPQPIKEE